jgi:hypothetical protein
VVGAAASLVASTLAKRMPYTASANANRAKATGVGSAIDGEALDALTGDSVTVWATRCGGAVVSRDTSLHLSFSDGFQW